MELRFIKRSSNFSINKKIKKIKKKKRGNIKHDCNTENQLKLNRSNQNVYQNVFAREWETVSITRNIHFTLIFPSVSDLPNTKSQRTHSEKQRERFSDLRAIPQRRDIQAQRRGKLEPRHRFSEHYDPFSNTTASTTKKPSLSTPRRHRCLSSTPPPLRGPIAIATVSNLSVSHHRSEPLDPDLSHSLFLLRSLSLGCVACVRLAVGLIGFHLICLSFIWFVCGFCLICLCILFGFVFIFYLYFRLWVCHANDVFDEMLLWVGLIIDKACF